MFKYGVHYAPLEITAWQATHFGHRISSLNTWEFQSVRFIIGSTEVRDRRL